MTKKAKSVSNGVKRDQQGRFIKGSAGGPGNPNVKRLAEYRAAVNAAVKPKQLQSILAVLVGKALKGDLIAIKEVLDRTVGRATKLDPSRQALALELPQIAKTSDAVAASDAILRAICDGRITAEDGTRLTQVVELARRTIETHEIAEQVEALNRKLDKETHNST